MDAILKPAVNDSKVLATKVITRIITYNNGALTIGFMLVVQ